MTQMQYDIIVKCIELGAPALANELIIELNKLVENQSEKQKEEK